MPDTLRFSTPSRATTAAEGFLSGFRGACLTRCGSLGHPLALSLFRSTFELTAKNAHFLAVIAPPLLRLPTQAAGLPEAPLRRALDRARDDLQAEEKVLAAQLGEAQLSLPRGYSSPQAVEARIVTPLSRAHWDLFLQADAFLLLLNLLWLEGLVGDDLRVRGEALTRARLRAVALAARMACLAVRARLREAPRP